MFYYRFFLLLNDFVLLQEHLASCRQLHSTTTDEVGYCIPFMIVLVTERLLERVSGLILTAPLAELRFIHALRLRRTNIRVCQLHNDMDIFCLFRECINS